MYDMGRWWESDEAGERKANASGVRVGQEGLGGGWLCFAQGVDGG